MTDEPTLRLYSDSLLSKRGFDDGDAPDEFIDGYAVDTYSGNDDVPDLTPEYVDVPYSAVLDELRRLAMDADPRLCGAVANAPAPDGSTLTCQRLAPHPPKPDAVPRSPIPSHGAETLGLHEGWFSEGTCVWRDDQCVSGP